jgi:hypothetical protein
MKNFMSALALLISLTLLSCAEKKAELSEVQVIGMRTTAMEFMKDLKSVLISQIQSNGVLQAVAVCSDTAQVLTNNFGVQRGVYIKRVSLKNRNSNNFPDEFEKKLLSKFELLNQNKELTSETEHAEIVQEGEFKYLRYLKPILVQAECLNCHGSETEIMPEVKQLIAQEYSNDKAVGYKIGDLRGAVSLKKVIE